MDGITSFTFMANIRGLSLYSISAFAVSFPRTLGYGFSFTVFRNNVSFCVFGNFGSQLLQGLLWLAEKTIHQTTKQWTLAPKTIELRDTKVQRN